MPELEEWDIRKWFVAVDLEQAEDTFRVVEGILQARREAQPVVKQRKRRSDAGTRRVPDDGVYVFGLIGSNEFFHWLDSHKDWWKRGRWSEKRCARSIRITDVGRKALRNKHLYDGELIYGGMVEPGYVVKPWPRKKAA